MVCLTALAGCATSTAGQVQEVGDGIYSVGIRNSSLVGQEAVLSEAVRKAGEYCHAKGQTLQVVPNPSGSDVRFRCVGSVAPPPAQPADDEGGH